MSSIKEVAKRAGVAISTVSKVLNHYPNISQETRDRVNAAIAELHFVPNAVAAALSSKQAGRVALLIDPRRGGMAIDEVDMQYLSGAMHRAQEWKLDVITVFFSMLQDKNVEEITRYFQSQSITGIIIYGMSKGDRVLQQLIASQAFKVVLVDAPMLNRNTSCVWIPQEEAQYAVAKKTIEMGTFSCKKILYLSGSEDSYVTRERTRGMYRLAEELGLSVLDRCGDFSELRARKLTFQYAEHKDMIVCASDLMAIGAMRALMEMDIFRPVCGFDGLTLMGYAGKQMNTVKQDFFRISGEAVAELCRLMNGGEGREVVLDYTLERLRYLDVIC